MFSAEEMNLDLSIAQQIHLEFMTVQDPLIKLELPVLQALATMETSDYEEALPLVGGWNSATTMSGAQCAMLFRRGGQLMPK